MATSKQEHLYNEIIEYYSHADNLLKIAQESSHNLAKEQFTIIEDVTSCLEDAADQLASQYIEFVKHGESKKVIGSIRDSLSNVATSIEECKAKIISLRQ